MGARNCTRVWSSLLLPGALMLVGCDNREDASMLSGAELSTQAFENLNADWRQRRVDRLTEPYGWLSLAGLVMLQADSETTVGSGASNDVVVSAGPSRWGSVVVDEAGRVRFDVTAEGEVRIDGTDAASGEMTPAGDGDPVHVEAGGVRIHLVAPGGQLALRVRDPEASTRAEFAGLDYYPLD